MVNPNCNSTELESSEHTFNDSIRAKEPLKELSKTSTHDDAFTEVMSFAMGETVAK